MPRKGPVIQVVTEGQFTEKHARFIDDWMQRVRDRVAREQMEAKRQAAQLLKDK